MLAALAKVKGGVAGEAMAPEAGVAELIDGIAVRVEGVTEALFAIA